MISITILLTCHNRSEKTKRCIQSLADNQYRIQYIVTDDGSIDATQKMLSQLQVYYNIKVLEGTGNLYWCGGMRKAIAYALCQTEKTDYYVLVNDDAAFKKGALKTAVEESKRTGNSVIAGAVCDQSGTLTYGGVRFDGKDLKYHTVDIDEAEKCDTFNCNFVLLPQNIFEAAGNFDGHYKHAMADFDYGLHLKRIGYSIYSSKEYLGVCERNSITGTWMDKNLSIRDRLRKKESPKGLPLREWFYYVHKNFGLCRAVWHSITPYIRIIAGR